MNAQVLIVTYRKDFDWLKFCLKSIQKFATGFGKTKILVPTEDLNELLNVIGGVEIDNWEAESGEEWPGKGMLWHQFCILNADKWCPEADFIAHFDADCVFTEKVTPETFIKDGKPVLQFERFDSIGKRHPGVLEWKRAAEACLPFTVDSEYMRGHPEVYHRGLYQKTRELIEQKTGKTVEEYAKSCRNEFPQTLAEFPTLGAVAGKFFRDKYHLVDNGKKPNPDKSDFPVFQAWSHGRPDEEKMLWYQGVTMNIRPLDIYKNLGLA